MAIEGITLFVIIVTYNGKQWYDRCFGSLRKSTLPITTIVVDNASNDGTAEYIKKNYPEIVLIESDKNLGFGQANNKAMRYALDCGCDYVFLLNQDAWVEPDTLERLVSIHKHNPEYGIVSPMHLNEDKLSFENGFLHYISDNEIVGLDFVNDLYFDNLEDVYSIKYVNAAAWLIPRIILENIGGFDPLFFHYGEDDNYMSRVLFHGYKIGICPCVRIVHDADNKGVRKTGKQESRRRQQVSLLIRFCDISNNESLIAYIIYLIRKTITKLLKFKLSLSKRNFMDAIYLCKMYKKIIYSRNINKSCNGLNWIK